MSGKGISADSQVHISIAFLIKAMIGISMMIAAYYQIQMKFVSIETRVNDMHEELVILNSKVGNMENKHIVELEEENRSLMQRLGLSKK